MAPRRPQSGRRFLACRRHSSRFFWPGDPGFHIGPGEHFITRGKVGLVAFDPEDEEDPEWVTAELVSAENAHVWKRDKSAGAGRDPRLLGDLRVAGVREMSFLDALARSRPLPPGELAGWPHPGERATGEFLRTLKMSDLEWITQHSSV